MVFTLVFAGNEMLIMIYNEVTKYQQVYVYVCLIAVSFYSHVVIVKVLINITMVITSESCTDGKYDILSLLTRLKEVVTIF